MTVAIILTGVLTGLTLLVPAAVYLWSADAPRRRRAWRLLILFRLTLLRDRPGRGYAVRAGKLGTAQMLDADRVRRGLDRGVQGREKKRAARRDA
ncbi:hypothetical protein [Actinoplanes sp. NPDC049316]|uniref:hypothetical protein n=1 Tax=Actinoplanes sp. NPDC049316 TaxID=3154727 RepID=UPI003423AD18